MIDNVDCDVTFDKVFIPSLEEMNCIDSIDPSYHLTPIKKGIEGSAWEFWENITQNNLLNSKGYNLLYDFSDNGNMQNDSQGYNTKPDYFLNRYILTRSPSLDDTEDVFHVDCSDCSASTASVYRVIYGSPAPAFVIG